MDDVPRSERFDDVYFSADDGLAETRHVFLRGNALPDLWAGRDVFTICETGFGTGLNLLAVLHLWRRCENKPKKLRFVSFEKYPVSNAYIARYLSAWSELSEEMTAFLACYPDKPGAENLDFTLFDSVDVCVYFGDVNDVMQKMDARVDCWFLDGFTPAKNPDMWSDTVFTQMARLSREDARFATFTAAGFVKRGLELAGFNVQKVKGFGRKREMLVGAYGGRHAG